MASEENITKKMPNIRFKILTARKPEEQKYQRKLPKHTNIICREINSQNIVHFFQQTHFGLRVERRLSKSLALAYARDLETFRVQNSCSPFDRRVTCIRWHPYLQNSLAASSHGGDLILWDHQSHNMEFIPGIGAGGSITEMKYNADNDNQLYTTSNCGQLALQDFERKTTKILLDTMDWEKWYCTVDISPCRRLIFAGDNHGYGVLLDKDGRELYRLRMHRKKCHHGEFNKRCDWLLATSSNDHTVKLWDVRKLHLEKDSKLCQNSIQTLEHKAPVTSAFFSPSDGNRLLTTSQDSTFSVFEGPNWGSQRLIVSHPHRHFQHLTPIKATWHPFHDLIVVGRYPDPNSCTNDPIDGKRTVDIYDAASGQLKCQLYDEKQTGIMVVNEFSPRADLLASGSGRSIFIWSHGDHLEHQGEIDLSSIQSKQVLSGYHSDGAQQHTNRRRKMPSKEADIDDLKKSAKSKLSAKTSTKRKRTDK